MCYSMRNCLSGCGRAAAIYVREDHPGLHQEIHIHRDRPCFFFQLPRIASDRTQCIKRSVDDASNVEASCGNDKPLMGQCWSSADFQPASARTIREEKENQGVKYRRLHALGYSSRLSRAGRRFNYAIHAGKWRRE